MVVRNNTTDTQFDPRRSRSGVDEADSGIVADLNIDVRIQRFENTLAGTRHREVISDVDGDILAGGRGDDGRRSQRHVVGCPHGNHSVCIANSNPI